MSRDVSKMSEEELREEVAKIRAERSGRGRVKRAASRSKRIQGQMSAKKRIDDAEKVENAEWV